MELLRTVVLVAATVTMGLVAGLFYVFAHAVMPGLGRSDDRTFVSGFQAIDKAITNPWFALSFVGALVFTGLAAALHLHAGGRSAPWWIIAGLLLYVVAVIITFRVHLPLNAAIQAAGAADRLTDLAAVRARFEAPWVRWNVVRTAASIAAFACLAWALVRHGRM